MSVCSIYINIKAKLLQGTNKTAICAHKSALDLRQLKPNNLFMYFNCFVFMYTTPHVGILYNVISSAYIQSCAFCCCCSPFNYPLNVYT